MTSIYTVLYIYSSSSDDVSLFRAATPEQSIVAASLNGKEPSEIEYPEGKVVFLNRDSQLGNYINENMNCTPLL